MRDLHLHAQTHQSLVYHVGSVAYSGVDSAFVGDHVCGEGTGRRFSLSRIDLLTYEQPRGFQIGLANSKLIDRKGESMACEN